MAKPTEQEYKEALHSKETFSGWLHIEYKNRDELLDKLLDSRETIKCYTEQLKQANEVIQKYEIYKELENKHGIQI